MRLFEAAACGCPIVSDRWDGIADVLEPGREVMLADTAAEVRALLDWPEARRREAGGAARRRILSAHTAAHRAAELEMHMMMQPKRSVMR